MKKLLTSLTLALTLFAGSAMAATTGAAAPTFSATDVKGQTVSLETLKGKTVVMEWTNYGCPYVRKQYDSKNMQGLQAKWTQNPEIIWVGVNSGGEGKEGYLASDADALKAVASEGAHYTHFIRDVNGTIGKAFGASTTPHMFVIDKAGTLVYQGAIDSNKSAAQSSIEGATNYVDQALGEITAGKPVSVSDTQSYGCSVKYKD